MPNPKTGKGIYGTGEYFAGYCWSPGSPAFNRLNLPGGAAEGTIVTFTDGTNTDIYEFRDTTPPSGGDASHIRLYTVGYRDNLNNAINGVVDAANITYPAGGQKINLFATIFGNVINFMTAESPGGTPCGFDSDSLNLTCSSNVAGATFDNASMQSGALPALARSTIIHFQLQAASIALGHIDIPIAFPSAKAILINQNRSQNEAWSVVAAGVYSYVTLTLAGGASPNNQAGDFIVVHAMEML